MRCYECSRSALTAAAAQEHVPMGSSLASWWRGVACVALSQAVPSWRCSIWTSATALTLYMVRRQDQPVEKCNMYGF